MDIVLLSGGLDSTTLLYYLKALGKSPTAVLVDYGQPHRKELSYARKHAAFLSVPILNLKFSHKSVPDMVDQPIVPFRNALFVLHVLASLNYRYVTLYLGVNKSDYAGFPDCRPEFWQSFIKALKIGYPDVDFSVETPFIYLDKVGILALFKSLVPGEMQKFIWWCYAGKEKPCGKCASCKEMQRAETLLNEFEAFIEKEG